MSTPDSPFSDPTAPLGSLARSQAIVDDIQRYEMGWPNNAAAIYREVIVPLLAEAWDAGYTSGHSRAMRRMSDEPNVEPGVNPYRQEGTDG